MTSSSTRILITCPPMRGSISRYQDKLVSLGMSVDCPKMAQVMSEEELIEIVPEYDGWIIGDDPATARVFAAGARGKLRAAVKWGVGVDNVDFEGARGAGIPVTNTPGMFSDEVADLAMSYVISLARESFAVNAGVWSGGWPKPVGMSLKGKVAALVGFGNIGQATATRLLASKLNIHVYDPFYKGGSALDSSVTFHRWPEQIERADFIVFCCCLDQSNRHMLNAEILANCKRGVHIVNVSRGPLIDEQALAASLASGAVHSAALEVFEIEPLPANSPLRQFRNCIFGSHNGSNTQEAVDATSYRAIELLHNSFAAWKPQHLD
jgi:D-3-phosphoglycerate dehydrogenase